jgi:hypothetical protein
LVDLFPLMIVAYLAVTIAREGGHATFAVLSGMTFGALSVHSYLKNSNWRIRLRFNNSLVAAGGVAVCFPAPWRGASRDADEAFLPTWQQQGSRAMENG